MKKFCFFILCVSGLLSVSCFRNKSVTENDSTKVDDIQNLKTGNHRTQRVYKTKWNAGSKNCLEPHFQVQEAAPNIITIRQSKCIHFEAPFIHVIFGKNQGLIIDSGAHEKFGFELKSLIQEIARAKMLKADYKFTLIHSHSHYDHTAGSDAFLMDSQFEVIAPDPIEVKKYFQIPSWPNSVGSKDLGENRIQVIPIPGHDDSSIAVYDEQSRYLFTGDTLYPGRLYVSNFEDYKLSVLRLVGFVKKKSVKAILGTHIEMSEDYSIDYAPGSIYHPNESVLELDTSDLFELSNFLTSANRRDYKRLRRTVFYPKFGAQ